MRRAMHGTILAVLAFAIWGAGIAAHAEPTATPGPATSTIIAPELGTARERALELEAQIEANRAEQVAIEQRIAVTNMRVFRQQEILAATREQLSSARQRFSRRVVRIYKSQLADPLTILLSAESISDFYVRLVMLGRLASQDRAALKDATVSAAEAEYQAAYLDDLKSQDVLLRSIKKARTDALTTALAEQKTLIDKLTEEGLQTLQAVRVSNKLTRKQWRDSSIGIGARIELTTATVEPHSDRTYLVPAHQPVRYRSTGRVETMVCSWYGNEFNGRPTASGQIFNEEDLTCASRTLPFGTRLALTFRDRRIIVVVTDRGPFIDGRDLDLSKAAARELGFGGVEPVEVEFVEAIE